MKIFKRLTALIMTVSCLFVLMGINVRAAATEYVECEFGVGSFLITTTYDGKTYYLPTTISTNGNPSAVAFTSVNEIDDSNLWIVTEASEGVYYIKNSSGKFLTNTSKANIRVNDGNGTWTYESDNKSSLKSNNNINDKRYLGIYNATDWRSYTTSNYGNYKGSGESLKFYKVASTDPKVIIGSTVSNLKIGEDFTFTAVSENITDPTAATWTSTDPTVASIDANGKLTALAMGSTNITATISDVVSEAVTVKVYPDNSQQISIATALEICTLTGDTDTPYKYTTVGTVKEVTGLNNFTLTDDTNDILVYVYGHGKEVGDKISITGALRNYNGDTPEFTSATFTNLYTVTFVSQGIDVKIYEDVPSGNTITEPTQPTNDGQIFMGWYNGEVEWNFEADAVTSNLTLTAKWIDGGLTQFLNDLNAIESYMSLAYKYTSFSSAVTDTLVGSDCATSTSYSNFSDVSKTSTAKYAGTAAKHSSSGAIQLNNNDKKPGIVTTASGGIASKVTVVWNSKETSSGRTINVYGSNTAYTAASDLYSSSTCGTLLGTIVYGTSSELIISGEYQYIGIISKSSALYLDSFTVEWGGATSFKDVDFRLQCGIDSLISVAAESLSTDAVYGIEVTDGSETRQYAYTNESLYFTDDANGIDYVIISLEDVLNNRDRLDMEFTVRAYVSYNGETYRSNMVKTYSIASIMQEYVNIADESVQSQIADFKAVLESFGYSFTGGAE